MLAEANDSNESMVESDEVSMESESSSSSVPGRTMCSSSSQSYSSGSEASSDPMSSLLIADLAASVNHSVFGSELVKKKRDF